VVARTQAVAAARSSRAALNAARSAAEHGVIDGEGERFGAELGPDSGHQLC